MSMAYTIKRYVGFVSLVLVFVFVLSTEARADLYLYGFEVIENNSNTAVVDQLSVKVTDPGGDQVLFTFFNDGPTGEIYDVPDPCQSSITDVYFEDGALLGIAEILDDPYNITNPVAFAIPATPANLTGANNAYPPFEATVDFTADSNAPVQPNGVNPDESLGIKFDLIEGATFDDVIAAINVGFDPYNPDYYDGENWLVPHLRIAIRVQGIGEFSDSLIMTPEPGSLLLGSIGIGMVIARCRKRKTLKKS